MPSPDFEQVVNQQVRTLVAENGAHLYFAYKIQELRKEGLGREVHAKIKLDHEQTLNWPVGIILPLMPDNTRHAVLLANNRVVVVESPGGDKEREKYKQYMSPNKGPLAWTLPATHDISHIEDTFREQKLLFQADFVKAFEPSAQPEAVEWAITIARAAKNAQGKNR
jgi:hypothetical protein